MSNHRHGLCKTQVYSAFYGMHERCGNPKNHSWQNYGGRGITVCERWDSVVNFLSDMGHPPSKKHSLDRIDNNGNYEPFNCRWATTKEQKRNMRITVHLTAFGETLPRADWADRLNLNVSTIIHRQRAGDTDEKCLRPPDGRFRNRANF